VEGELPGPGGVVAGNDVLVSRHAMTPSPNR
jgi:hypothetical protein